MHFQVTYYQKERVSKKDIDNKDTNCTHDRVLWMFYQTERENVNCRVGGSNLLPRSRGVTRHECTYGVVTPNQIPLTTIVTYLQKRYRSRISNHWSTIPACSVVTHPHPHHPPPPPPTFTNSPRKHTVTYHFSDLQEVYSGNRQIRTKCQLQYLHPPHISTSGKCHCVIIHQTTKATEYIG